MLFISSLSVNINASASKLKVEYPDGYSTGRLIYANGAGVVCEDGKDHKLFKLGGEERFLCIFSINGEVVYCIQPFVETKNGYVYTSSAMSIKDLDNTTRDKLELASYFGYGYNGDKSLLTRIATQNAIWEFQGVKVEQITSELRNRTDVIKQRVNDYLNKKKPSFNEKLFTFKGYGEENAIVVKDDHNTVLEWYKSSSSAGLNYSISGNEIKVWINEPFEGTKSITYNLYNPNDTRVNGNSIVYINPNNAQKLAKFCDPVKREANVHFTMASGDMKIEKYMNSNSEGTGVQTPEEGAHFIVMKEDYVSIYGSIEEAYAHKDELHSSEYDYLITNEEGTAFSKTLTAGKYLIKQVKGAVDTQLYDEVLEFNVEEAKQETKVFTLTNLKYASKLKVVKVDENNNKITASGMKFKIKDEKGVFVEKKIGEQIVNEWETGKDGTIILPFKLDAGKYFLVETKAPDGFVLNKEDIAFVITNAQDVVLDEHGEPMVSIVVKNEKAKGKIILHKEFEDPANLIGDGVVFALYANETIVNPTNGETLFSKNDLVSTYKLNANDVLEINNLPLGMQGASFVLKEVQTYDNYQLDLNEYLIEFTLSDQNTKEYVVKKDLLNKLIRLQTMAYDQKDNDKTFDGMGDIIIEDLVSYEGLHQGEKYLLKGYLVDKASGNVVLDQDNKVISNEKAFICENVNGQMTMSFTFNASYFKDKELVVFEQLYNDKNELIASHADIYDANQTIKIRPVYDIEVTKVDQKTKKQILDTFEFSLYADETCNEKIASYDVLSNKNTLVLSDLAYGIYYLKESKAPSGYMLSDKVMKLEINEDGLFIDNEKVETNAYHYCIYFENRKIPVILTGDSKNKMSLISLLFLSLLILKKKKK